MFETATGTQFYPSGGHDRVDVLVAGDARALVIADGMGGRSGAARAAEMWIEAVRTRAAAHDAGKWADTDFWVDLMAEADRAIRDDSAAGETTAVVAVITPSGLAGASVGDSGAWLIGDDDHVDLTKSQIRKPGLGTGMATPMPFYRRKPPAGTLLLATDGLLKYTSPAKICATVRAASAVELLPTALIDLVRMPSGGLQDDVAVAVARARR